MTKVAHINQTGISPDTEIKALGNVGAQVTDTEAETFRNMIAIRGMVAAFVEKYPDHKPVTVRNSIYKRSYTVGLVKDLRQFIKDYGETLRAFGCNF
ncbi:MAG: hypothetical protein EBX40_00455 [Gammaproteobacteria bacterium]|nr:hypothetical protein [Gammaproteobacteria bacterium]